MFEGKGTSGLAINLEGLNLSDEHLEKINGPVQRAAMPEFLLNICEGFYW